MKRRAVLALGLFGLSGRVLAQANAHDSTTDPLVFWWPDDDDIEGSAKARLVVQ